MPYQSAERFCGLLEFSPQDYPALENPFNKVPNYDTLAVSYLPDEPMTQSKFARSQWANRCSPFPGDPPFVPPYSPSKKPLKGSSFATTNSKALGQGDQGLSKGIPHHYVGILGNDQGFRLRTTYDVRNVHSSPQAKRHRIAKLLAQELERKSDSGLLTHLSQHQWKEHTASHSS